MNELKITKENALKLYGVLDERGKEMVDLLWPGEFVADPYLLACAKLGKTPKPPLADRSDLDAVSCDAYDRLIICIRVKNMVDGKVWKQVYDGSEYHYTPRFQPDKSGFGFSRTAYDGWYTNSGVGSRLEYRSYDLMIEGVNEFAALYNDLLTN